jgi:hypothetical protein
MRARAWLMCLMLVAVTCAPVVPAEGAGEGAGAARADLGLYHTYDEMISELQNLTAAHPMITKLMALGQTYENRTIWAVKLSDNVDQDEAEPNITFMGGIHARELIGVEVPLYILGSLVENYSSNASVRRLVDGSQMWFIPMLNPDGHVYVEQTGDWRKNRHPYTGGIGVDINRNFGHLWGAEAPHDASAEDFCGPEPFSENETRAVRDIVSAHPMTASVSYHSGYATILYPWGNSIDQTAVDQRLPSLAENMSLAMPAERRLVPRMARELYPATGDTDDWLYANKSVLPFTVELSTVFRPPEGQIGQICADNFLAAVTLMDFCIPSHAISINADRTGFSSLPGNAVTVNISVENVGNVDEPMTLTASCNLSWNISLSPGRLTVAKGKTASSRLTVTVPEGAPAFWGFGIDVLAVCDSGAVANASLRGTVELLHRLQISLAAPSGVAVDSLAAVNVTVRNLGNGRESLSLTAGTRNGWDLAPPPLPFVLNLSAGETNTTTVNVIIPVDALAGPTGQFYFRATSSDSLYQANDSCVLTVLPRRDLRLQPPPSMLTLKEGERRNITLNFDNRGNVPENGSLVISGDFRWATIENSTLNIAPFSKRSVNVSLEGKRPGRNLTLSFLSPPEDTRVRHNMTITVTANTTGNATGAVPPANAILVLVVAAVVLVAVLGFIMWDLRRHEEKERMERDRYESIAAGRPKKVDRPPPPGGNRTMRGP